MIKLHINTVLLSQHDRTQVCLCLALMPSTLALCVMALDMGGIFLKNIAFCSLQIANKVSITRDVIIFFLKPLNGYHGTPPIHVRTEVAPMLDTDLDMAHLGLHWAQLT